MIATTKDQSARLLKCGVSADTADMLWARLDEARDHNLYAVPWYTPRLPNRKITDNNIPAWSLSALLTKVLPHNISVDKYKYKEATEYEVGCYFTGHRDKIAFTAPDPIEACVQLIEWLKENGYKLNEQ